MASALPSQVPLLVSLGKAAALCGLTRYQLWRLNLDRPGELPILRLGKRKRLVDPLALKRFLETTFAPAPPAEPPRRPRGRPRKASRPSGEEVTQ